MKKILLIVSALFLLGSLLPGCKKDTPTSTPALVTTPASPLSVHDNVLVVDSTKHSLDMNPAKLKAGTYSFTASSSALNAPVGTIIVGDQGRGFLRRVTAATTSGKQTTLQTQAASLDELFAGGTLTMRPSADSLRGGRTASSGFSYAITNQPVYQNGGLTLTLRNGTVALNPNWVIEAGFGANGTVTAKAAAQGATLDGNFEFNLTAAQAATLVNRQDTLNKKPYYKDFVVYVPVVIAGIPVRVPVKARMNLYFLLQYSATISATITRDITYTNHSTFDAGVSYSNNQWQGIYSFTPTNSLTMGPRSGQATANVRMAVVPRVSFELYNAVGPYTSIGLQTELQAAVASPALDWNFQADAWLHTTVGVTGSVFGKKMPDYSTSWDTNKITYKTPDHLERTSGDNQTGTANIALPNPVKVRVLDSNNKPESGVPVYFTPATGNGSATPTSILSDANGYAQATWTLGASTTTIQHLNASAKTAAGQAITGTPVDFAAVGTISPYCDGIPLQFDSLKVVYQPRGYYNGSQGRYWTIYFIIKGGIAPFTLAYSTPGSTGGIQSCINAQSHVMGTNFPCSWFNGVSGLNGINGFICQGASAAFTFTVTDAKGTSEVKSIVVSY